ncbi:ABC transporter ATP-binding protein [Bacillus sp. 1P06AnD]|uniref:ABC transporter ATP-binding protein n=1 Tax=Bacillus sp. 1P06AnD TaxID=3132208 RepID=UPI0039A020AC
MQSAKQLVKYVKPYTILAIMGPLLMVVEVVMDLIQPTIMQHIIDTGIAGQNHAYVIKMGLLMILSAIIGLLGGAGCSIYSSRAAIHFASDIRKDVFEIITQFSNRNKDSFGTGKLITIMTNDVETLQRALMMTLKVFVRGPLLFIGSVVIVFLTARELFPVLLVVVPLLMICMYFFTKISGTLFQKVQEAIDSVNVKLQENLAGIRVIKAFNRRDHHMKEFSEVNSQLTRKNIRADQVVGVLMPLTMFVINMGIVAALWMGAIKVSNHTLQVGVLLAFINYLTIIMNGLISSSNVLVQIARAFPSAHRIQQVLQTKVDIQNVDSAPSFIKGAIQFKNVSFSYSKNGEYVLKNLSFSAKPGETIGIIGTTGSGKSTLVKLIPRLFDCDEGDIELDGVSIKQYNLQTLRKAIGFTPQKATLFSGSIEENMKFGKEKADDKDMEAALAASCAAEFVSAYEDGYRHMLSQGAANLSGGQKQRLSMARAFIRKPSILILDDSTSAVDSLSEHRIQKAIKKQQKECTTFIVASKISSIKHANQILVLEDGRLIGSGTHEQLLSENAIYQEIYSTQIGKESLLDESTSKSQ